MKIYLVGGAVRDALLGRPVKERDWVVVGASPEQMLAEGYRPVGKDFPVFLHPKTQEEYALARTERKTSKGYNGFACYAAPDVSLEDDLKRRDLTINAMAEATDGTLIDPHGGQADLKGKIFRHVSAAFSEDPVRILRIARFSARMPEFHVHLETLELMKQMVRAGEVDALVAERVWQELERALGETDPQQFFNVLDACGALDILFPEIKNNFSDAVGSLNKLKDKTDDSRVRFASLFQKTAQNTAKKLCSRYNIPREFQDLAVIIEENYSALQNAETLNGKELLKLFEKIDAFRRPNRVSSILLSANLSDKEKTFIENACNAASDIPIDPKTFEGMPGHEIGKIIEKKRLKAIQHYLSQ